MIKRMYLVLLICAVVASVSSADMTYSSARVSGDLHWSDGTTGEDESYDETGAPPPTVFGQVSLGGELESYHAESWALVDHPSECEFLLEIRETLDAGDTTSQYVDGLSQYLRQSRRLET